MANDVFLLLHGWGGNKPAHWQEHLYVKLTETGAKVHYPKMPTPEAPDLPAWQARLRGELDEIAGQTPGARLHVLAHSLGSINWIHLAASRGGAGTRIADRVLLVAPPYVVPQILPIDVTPAVAAFFPPPMSAAGIKAAARETVLIASDTDDYSTFDQSCGYSRDLDIPIHKLAVAGHISPYYGYGEWPWVLDWCLGRAELPPVPRSG
jgi:uncharacterized protein